MKKALLAGSLYVILSLAFTWPLALHFTDSVPGDPGDPLLNAWILDWDLHKLTTGMSGFWDANIFAPYRTTLAYSENLIGIALLALPLRLLHAGTVAVYNSAFLFSFASAAFGAFLLARYLTGSFSAGVLAGLIYGFSPFRFGQAGHLQVLWCQWIPFGILFLHRYADTGKKSDLAAFSFFFLLQCLSSMYNGFFMGLYVAGFAAYYARKARDRKTLAGIAVAALAALLLFWPVLRPYLALRGEFSFFRGISPAMENSARIENFLGVDASNVLYGGLLRAFSFGEGRLFPGFTVILLVLSALRTDASFAAAGPWRTAWKIIFAAEAACAAALAVFGARLKLHASSFMFATQLTALLLARWFSDKPLREDVRGRIASLGRHERFYLYVLAASLLMALGPQVQFLDERSFPGVYLFFYHLFPGFDGIRVPARMAVVLVLAVSVLAGYGYVKLAGRLPRPAHRRLLFAAAACLLAAEYASFNLRLSAVTTPRNVPGVYRWLGGQKGRPLVMEFPIDPRSPCYDILYVYNSSFHRKDIVNGYSGYQSPLFQVLAARGGSLPTERYIALLRECGVDLLVVHSDLYDPAERDRVSGLPAAGAAPAGEFGPAFVYAIRGSTAGIPAPAVPDAALLLPKKGWKVTAGANGKYARHMIDGTVRTRWDTGAPKAGGESVTVDLGSAREISSVWLSMRTDYNNYPDPYLVEVSADGSSWEKAAGGELDLAEYVRSVFHSPRNARIGISFKPVAARFVRITQSGEHFEYFWSISELDIGSAPPPSSALP